MKLNVSCVRDILLTVEKYEGFRVPVTFCTYPRAYAYYEDFLSNYEQDEISYHVQYCVDANLLLNETIDRAYFKCSLTPAGHDFLSNIRTEEHWTRTKSILSKLGGASLKVVSATAEGVATAFMNKYLSEELKNI